MIKVAVVEDEKEPAERLKDYMQRFSHENKQAINLQIFSSGESFLRAYTDEFDIVWFDVEMPGINGLETAKRLRAMNDRVIILFLTKMAQYAVNGYEVNAVDFAIKPITYADFSLKMNKAVRYMEKTKSTMIPIVTADSMVYADIADIYYVEVIRHYLIYHTKNGDYTARGTMKAMEEKLKPYSFVRVNYCYLVNLKYVHQIKGEDLSLSCGGKETVLKISRNRKKEFIDEVAKYMGGLL